MLTLARTISLKGTSVTVLALCVSGQDLVINEIRIDELGTDLQEYVELRGAAGTSLDGLTYLVIGDGSGGSGVIDGVEVVDLGGQVIPASGLFVVAESTFTLGTADFTTDLGFENADNVTHLLVEDFTGAVGDDLDVDDDGVLDVAPWSSVVDRVALTEEANPPTGTEFNYGPPFAGPDGPFVPGHFFRADDGTGSLVSYAVGRFDLVGGFDTPGAANAVAGRLSQALGGTINLALDAGVANAGQAYLTLLNASGTVPGTPLTSGLVLPLNLDVLLMRSASSAGISPFLGTVGELDEVGQAPFQRIALPPLPAGFLGLTLNAASVVLEAQTSSVVFVSNAIGVEID